MFQKVFLTQGLSYDLRYIDMCVVSYELFLAMFYFFFRKHEGCVLLYSYIFSISLLKHFLLALVTNVIGTDSPPWLPSSSLS